MAIESYATLEENNSVSTLTTPPTPTQRGRWATQHMKGKRGSGRRTSILNHLNYWPPHSSDNNRHSRRSGTDLGFIQEELDVEAAPEAEVEDRDNQGPRTIFFNIPLPPDAVDESGHPLKHYRRNKIRTAKYTPLSFIPRNLWYQFHNVANVYFLFLIILAIFPIFGSADPGLTAVPLIVIVVITAVKDAIEDYRRAILDNELNNSPVHRMVDWNNANINVGDISLWRRFKKATSRTLAKAYRLISQKKDTCAVDCSPREPYVACTRTRASVVSTLEGIQMTPVPSPSTRDDMEMPLSQEHGGLPTTKNFGSLINPRLPVTGKPRFHQDCWKNVQVGDFIRVYNNDQIPADVVILSTSDPDGACYVETKNLDGETNLKVRHAVRSGRKIKHARDCEQTEFYIESEPPQANLYQYSGTVRWNQHDPRNPNENGLEMAEPISINNLLLRGCNLRNTEWALAVVVFTGFDTKIMLNAGITPSKRSRISRELNGKVIYNFIILAIMCLLAGLIEGIAWRGHNGSLNFFEFSSIGGTPALNGLVTFWAAVSIFQNMVPISLYITLEAIKTCQAFFIYSDTEMYYDKLDYPCTPKSWNISDDLGQIEYIFSDKTGTLTQNVMEFKKASINGVPYGKAYTEALAGIQKRKGIDVDKEGARLRREIDQARAKMLIGIRKMHDNPYLHDDDLTFIAPDFIKDLAGESGRTQQDANEQFMLALALCHSVISETAPGDPPRIEFKAQSPDEAALVATARDVGFSVLGRSPDGIRLNVLGEERLYLVLNTLEFNSSRKRMSAIIRMPDNTIILFCKGADSIIYSRLSCGEQAELRNVTADHLEMFAREGLRTLCVAQRVLSEEEYQNWNREHELAATAIQDREDKLEAVADSIERELTLLGGTAIEDRLQEGVPDTISLLAEAGIKLWVLTGDKVETAINIGFSCNLLNNSMKLIILKIEDGKVSTAEAELDKHLVGFGMTGSDDDLKVAKKSHVPPAPTHGLVIDGDSLKLVLDNRLRQKFLILCKQCKAVLCCRVSPAQKAAVVAMVKGGLDVMTLSIGDGANDVAMIQEADVGVGIAGEEGRQAVMSSDYAIGQFWFLQRLILVHGRWSYQRLAESIANFFYKNVTWTFTIFWYQIYCNFDTTYLYDYTYLLLINLAFTSLPVLLMGVLDQDVSDKVSLAVPQLYRRGIERLELTQRKFWLYMLDGFYQSVICFFTVYLLFQPGNFVSNNGLSVDDRERLGAYVAPATVASVNIYVLLNTYRWDWLMMLLTALSILLVWFWTGIYSSFSSSDYFYKAAAEVFGLPTFWAVTCLTIVVALLPNFIIKVLQKVYFPYDIDIIRERVQRGEFDNLDIAANEVLSKGSSAAESGIVKPINHTHYASVDEDQRPIYPPSVAPTATTHNGRSRNGSDGTEYYHHRVSAEVPAVCPPVERSRASYNKMRA